MDLEAQDIKALPGKGNIVYTCEWCGKRFRGCPSRAKAKHICCSKPCMSELTKFLTVQRHTPNAICPICKKEFWVKPTHLCRFRQVCCSNECATILKRERMLGEKNHQYGLKGKLNASWKSDEKISNYGYKLIRKLDHPFANCDGFVFEHRLVAEQFLLTPENTIMIDGKPYLSPNFDVHHIDENKLNNDVSNLMVISKSEHKAIHNKRKPRKKDPHTGRFIKQT